MVWPRVPYAGRAAISTAFVVVVALLLITGGVLDGGALPRSGGRLAQRVIEGEGVIDKKNEAAFHHGNAVDVSSSIDWHRRLTHKRSQKNVTRAGHAFTSFVDYSNCYIITLLRDKLRVEHVNDQTQNVFPGAHLWPAIDGASIPDSQIEQWKDEGYLGQRLLGFMDPRKPMGKPKISCLMSHARVWEHLVMNSSSPYFFVLEDDAFPSDDFSTRYPEVLAELADIDWDWVYLAIHPTFARKNTKTIPGKKLINYAPRMVGNAGYLVSRRGAKKLLEGLFPCTLPKDQAIRIMIENGNLNGYIVKSDLIVVKGQQGRGFNASLKMDPNRVFKSNIWDK